MSQIEGQPWTCPNCNSISPIVLKSCWSCFASRPDTVDARTSDEAATTESAVHDILFRYVGEVVEINFDTPNEAEPAVLAGVHRDYLTVFRVGYNTHFHFPIRHILRISESNSVVGPIQRQRLTIELYRQVFTKGFFGVGLSTPL